MQNIHDLLRRKEIELEKVTKEVAAVRMTVQLVEQENEKDAGNGRVAVPSTNRSSGAVGTNRSTENVTSPKPHSIQEFP